MDTDALATGEGEPHSEGTQVASVGDQAPVASQVTLATPANA
jgi:hypothetical protein